MDSTPPIPDLTRRNLQAWNRLYGASSELVWGAAAVGFLRGFLEPEYAAGRRFRRALDAGAGEGRNLPLLRDLAEGVVACDGSAEALAKLTSRHGGEVQTVRSELAQLPFPDAAFDLVLLCDTIETLPEPEPVLRELRRVIAADGRLVCNFPEPEGDVAGTDMVPAGADGFLYEDRYFYRFTTPEQARWLLESTGWRVVREQTMTWTEEAHPGFRDYTHGHCSRVFLVEPLPSGGAGGAQGG